MDGSWVGFDPGGINKFGVALIADEKFVASKLVSSVQEAVDAIDDIPDGVGIDAPLWWSTSPGGGRMADQWIRDTYSISSGNVQSVNSLRGAVIAQAFLLVDLLRKKFGEIRITESHPKALLIAEYGHVKSGSKFFQEYGLDVGKCSEHERDAVVAAVCAREGFSGRWTKDLTQQRSLLEQDPKTHWIGPVHYFWPAPNNSKFT